LNFGRPSFVVRCLALACIFGVSSARAAPGGSGASAPPQKTAGVVLTPPAGSLVPQLELHGGMSMYLYQPTNGYDGQFFVYSNLKLDATWDWFGIYMEPRLTSEKMRPYYDSLAWIQQAYAHFSAFGTTLKVGKVYKRVGLAWDRTFYGNIQVYEGLKFDPNLGLSLEGKFGKNIGLAYFAQYFYIDGHLNASLTGRDTVSIEGARRRNTFAGRLEPYFQLTDKDRLEFGLSAEAFTADLPETNNSVTRLAADVTLTVHKFAVWGEVLGQWGANVTGFPVTTDGLPHEGVSSERRTYLLAGCEMALGPIVPRYNVSIANYSDVAVREILHVPGVSLNIHPHATIFIEYAFWDRIAPEGRTVYDRSLNVTVQGFF
jgi:hypothetical protein